MIIKDIVIIFSLMSLSGVVISQNQEFCQSFANNNFIFGFGEFGLSYILFPYHNFLIIGHDFWRLKWDESSQELKFVSTLSKRTDLFGSEYRMVFTADKGNYQITGRVSSEDNYTIDWAVITFDEKTDTFVKEKDDFKKTNELSFFGKYAILMAFNYYSKWVCVVLQTGSEPMFSFPVVIESQYYFYRMSQKPDSMLTDATEEANNFLIDRSVTQQSITVSPKPRSTSNLSNITSVFNQLIAGVLYVHPLKKYVYLLKSGKQITYCLTHRWLINKNCEVNQKLQLLIDCGQYTKSSTPNTTQVVTQHIPNQSDVTPLPFSEPKMGSSGNPPKETKSPNEEHPKEPKEPLSSELPVGGSGRQSWTVWSKSLWVLISMLLALILSLIC